jgi:hypothetical protein
MAISATLIATATFAFAGSAAVSAAPSTAACTVNTVPMNNPGTNPMPTRWKDQTRPPDTIKVRRTSGPDSGKVQTVPFWNYVSTVFRTEFSGGGFAASALRAGAVSVKQYAWYYSMNWRGGKVAVYGPDPDGEGPEVKPLLGYDCYDVMDSTADQLYKPEKPLNGGWVVNNYPYPTNLDAMAATWHISLRKDFLGKKGKPNKIFVTGYRTGSAVPCGHEDGTFRLYQKSVKDCGVKGMTTEEIWRQYYGSNLYVVDVRDHDMLVSDWDGDYRGDIGFVNGGNWSVASANPSGFGSGPNGSLGSGTVLDAAVGDVTGLQVPPPDPPTGTPTNPYRKPTTSSNVADLVTLVEDSGRKVVVYKSNGSSLTSFATFDAPGAERVLVADFDGDMTADIGVVRSPGGGDPWTLQVKRSLNNGNFSGWENWWNGAVDLSTSTVLAGDVNTDGKADLVITDGNTFRVAKSPQSCLDLSTTGTCKSLPAFKLSDAESWLVDQGWDAAGDGQNARLVVGDWNRDGRDDVMALVKDGNGVKVVVLKSMPGGSFQSAGQTWANATATFESLRPVAFHGNLDGFADLALLQNTGNPANPTEFWLSTTSTGTMQTATAMTLTGSPSITAGQPWASGPAF